MKQFTIDARQLDNWDFMSQLPTKVSSGRSRSVLGPSKSSALQAAVRLGSSFGLSPMFQTADEILGIASPPKPTVSILTPVKNLISSSVAIKFSSSSEFTGSIALASSLAAVATVLGSTGIYASTTREIGFFSTLGAGITFNTPSASAGGEVSLIRGTPLDLAGNCFGLSFSAGTGTSFGFTLLFSPTLGGTPPLILTYIGVAINISATTPTKLPLTVTIEVTNTQISGIHF